MHESPSQAMIILSPLPQNSGMEAAANSKTWRRKELAPTDPSRVYRDERTASSVLGLVAGLMVYECWLIRKPKQLLAMTRTYEEANVMQDRLLRRREVEKITGMSRSSIYRLMQESDFPRPVKAGPSAVRWKLSHIMAWIESRPVARSEFS